jgi:hypothetical protein
MMELFVDRLDAVERRERAVESGVRLSLELIDNCSQLPPAGDFPNLQRIIGFTGTLLPLSTDFARRFITVVENV